MLELKDQVFVLMLRKMLEVIDIENFDKEKF